MKLNLFPSSSKHPVYQCGSTNTSFQVRGVFSKKSKAPYTVINSAVKSTERNGTHQRIIDKAMKKTLAEAKKPTKKESNIQYETLYNHVVFRATSEVNAHLEKKANEIKDPDIIKQAQRNIEKNLKNHLDTDCLMNSGPLRTYLVSGMEKNMARLSKKEREELISLAYKQLDQNIDEIIRTQKLDTYSVKEITQYASLLVNNEFPEKIKEVATPSSAIQEKKSFKKLLKRDQDFPMAFRRHQS
ncbi:hypothetical protein [Vibrio sp.]|uniref:hypothetical protein n=1 Tax=Vibrio sp. TaxID=678 RepID=UPI00311E5900